MWWEGIRHIATLSLVGAPCNFRLLRLRFIKEVSWEYRPRVFAKEFEFVAYFQAEYWLEYTPVPRACQNHKHSVLNINLGLENLLALIRSMQQSAG